MAPENPALHALVVFPRFRLSEAVDFHWKHAAVQLGLKHAASGRTVWRAGDLRAWMMWRVSSMMLGRYHMHLTSPPQTPVVEENRLDQRAAAALEGAPPMVGTSEPHPRTDEINPRAEIYLKMM